MPSPPGDLKNELSFAPNEFQAVLEIKKKIYNLPQKNFKSSWKLKKKNSFAPKEFQVVLKSFKKNFHSSQKNFNSSWKLKKKFEKIWKKSLRWEKNLKKFSIVIFLTKIFSNSFRATKNSFLDVQKNLKFFLGKWKFFF